ncbi:MAG TPA: F0F1 ATP synthase subunit B [Treponemataceae bacterium]|nr:F0F1 ATP synthase subunit B [Treponemataceae bacterium]
MLDFSVTFLITVVNVTVLFLVLRKLLFKPVTKFMEDRTERVRRELEVAKNTSDRAESLAREYEEKLENARAEGQRLIDLAREKAERESAAIVAKGHAEAERIVAQARLALEDERRDAERKLLDGAADLTIEASSRVLGENIDSAKNRDIVRKFLDSVGVA